jgi:RNA polymerase sigma-70 factor (ECF subfamily)
MPLPSAANTGKQLRPRTDDDTPLVEQILGGNKRAFEEMVRKHERRVFRVALAITGNQQDAEEAMQDTFVKVYRRLADFRREARFTTWLTRIAVNEALQLRRVRQPAISLEELSEQAELPAPHRVEEWYANPEKRYARQEIREFVENAIRSLAPDYRVAFILRDVEGFSTNEAAEVLGLSIPALKSRLLRARLMVREALAVRLEKRPGWKVRLLRAGSQLRRSVAARLGQATRSQSGD